MGSVPLALLIEYSMYLSLHLLFNAMLGQAKKGAYHTLETK